MSGSWASTAPHHAGAEHVHGLHGLPFGEPGARVECQADVSGLDLTPVQPSPSAQQLSSHRRW